MELTCKTVLALRAPAGDSGNHGMLYALLDHAAIPALTKTLTRMNVRWTSLFDGSRDAGALEVAPILIPICNGEQQVLSIKALEWICRNGQFTSSLLFFESGLSTPELARQLACRMDATLPGGVDVVFRYFDSRVFEAAMEILDGPQRRHFLSVASAWWFVDRSGKLVAVTQDGTMQIDTKRPLEFTIAQESRFLEMSEVDNVIGMVKEYVNDKIDAIPPTDRHDFFARHIQAARQTHVKAAHEIALYCVLVLDNGDDYFECGQGRELLVEMNSKSISLADVLQAS